MAAASPLFLLRVFAPEYASDCACQEYAEACAKAAMEHGLRKVAVFLKGPGSGRETALRSLQAAGLEVSGVQDKTPIPHNGCRPVKRRRV